MPIWRDDGTSVVVGRKRAYPVDLAHCCPRELRRGQHRAGLSGLADGFPRGRAASSPSACRTRVWCPGAYAILGLCHWRRTGGHPRRATPSHRRSSWASAGMQLTPGWSGIWPAAPVPGRRRRACWSPTWRTATWKAPTGSTPSSLAGRLTERADRKFTSANIAMESTSRTGLGPDRSVSPIPSRSREGIAEESG